MSRSLRIAAILIGAFSLSVYFVNCAGGLPDIKDKSKTSDSNSSPVTVVASAVPAQINTKESAQIVASGGQPPYTFSVSQGIGNVSASGAVWNPGIGSLVISV